MSRAGKLRCVIPTFFVLLLLPCPCAADEVEPGFDALVVPLRAEAGPILSPVIDPVPRTGIWASAGVRYASREQGLATYKVVQTALVIGGEWSPEKLERLGIGADLVAFQTTTLTVDLPPVIDEQESFFDLGVLRLRAKVRALELARLTPRKGFRFELVLTPFFALGFPTDTSRIREERRMPVRGAIDDRVFEGPYFLIELGVTLGMSLGVFSLYTHQGALFAPIHGEDKTHFYYSMHYGLAARIAGVVELVTEFNGLLRFTRDYNEERLLPWAFAPGIRVLHGNGAFELSARVGLNDDAYHPYGDFTLSLGFSLKLGGGKEES